MKKRVVKFNESDLEKIIQKILKEEDKERSSRYMFFSNLEQIKKQADILLTMNRDQIGFVLDDGHDWAQDHIASSKENLDQVFDFLTNKVEEWNKNDLTEGNLFENKNCADTEKGCIRKRKSGWVILNNKKGGVWRKCDSKKHCEEILDAFHASK